MAWLRYCMRATAPPPVAVRLSADRSCAAVPTGTMAHPHCVRDTLGARLFRKGGRDMRLGVFFALASGLLTVAAHAETDSPRATYVALVLQAFAAKVECPGTDVAYQDLLQKAKEMKLPDGTTEQVRKAIAFMHTGGKRGEKGDDTLMKEVAIATQSTDFDQRRLGMASWCET